MPDRPKVSSRLHLLPSSSLYGPPLVWANCCSVQECSCLPLDLLREKGVRVTPDPDLQQPVAVNVAKAGAQAVLPCWPCALSIRLRLCVDNRKGLGDAPVA